MHNILLVWVHVGCAGQKLTGGARRPKGTITRRITTMSASETPSTNTIKTYKNMLEAHTAFVLDRYGFMDTVQAAVMDEDCSGAHALFSLFNAGNFGELIVGLFADPDQKNREQALYTVANLLALEHQPAIVQRVLTAVLQMRDKVFENLYPLSTQRTTAYLIHNIALACHKVAEGFLRDPSGCSIDIADIDNFQMDLIQIFNCGCISLDDISASKVRCDLLYALSYVAEQVPFGLRMGAFMRMAAECGVKEQGILLKILSIRLASNADEDDFTRPTIPSEFHGQVLDFFLQLLEDDIATRAVQSEALAALSNFVVEEGVADMAAVYNELMTAVIHHSLMTTGSLRANGVWVLANIIKRVRGVVAIEAVRGCHGIWTALSEAVADAHDTGRWNANIVAAEAIAQLTAWQEADEAVADSKEDDAEDMEVDEESVESDDSDDSDYVPDEDDESSDDDDSATDEDEVMKPAAPVQMTRRVPNALDLLMADRVPSETVARLASMASATEWVEVPADVSLTIDDLTSLQLMGYTLYRGYIGINPALFI